MQAVGQPPLRDRSGHKRLIFCNLDEKGVDLEMVRVKWSSGSSGGSSSSSSSNSSSSSSSGSSGGSSGGCSSGSSSSSSKQDKENGRRCAKYQAIKVKQDAQKRKK